MVIPMGYLLTTILDMIVYRETISRDTGRKVGSCSTINHAAEGIVSTVSDWPLGIISTAPHPKILDPE